MCSSVDLPAPGRPHDRDELARLDVERDAPQHESLAGADRKGLLDARIDMSGALPVGSQAESVTAEDDERLKNMSNGLFYQSACRSG